MKRLSYLFIITFTVCLASCSSKKAVMVNKNSGQTVINVVPSSDKKVSELIKQARTWIGTPYVYGGHTRKKGTDCSGMVMELFLDVYNLKLPRSSAMQREFSRPVKYENMTPGDLVFFTTNKNSSRINHVGLYIGDNRMIHASSSRGVIETSLSDKYWQNAYHSSGSVIETDKRARNNAPVEVLTPPSISFRDLQKLYDALDEQIDSIYVTDPAIFD